MRRGMETENQTILEAGTGRRCGLGILRVCLDAGFVLLREMRIPRYSYVYNTAPSQTQPSSAYLINQSVSLDSVE